MQHGSLSAPFESENPRARSVLSTLLWSAQAHESPTTKGYILAAVSLAIAGIVRLALDPLLHEKAAGSMFLLAVGVTSWYGGFWPAIAASLVSFPIYYFGFGRALEHLPMSPTGTTVVIYLTCCLLLSYFGERQRIGRIRGRRATKQLAEANHELALQKSYFQRLFESSQSCVMVLSPEGRIEMTNLNGMSLLDIEPDGSVEGTSWTMLWDAQGKAAAERAVRHAMRGEIARFEGLGAARGGDGKWWEVVVSPIQNEKAEVQALLAVSRDVTEQKEMDEKLQRTVALRTKELLDANEKLQGFIYSVAHDFRQLIRGISTNAAMILHDAGDRVDDEMRATLHRMVDSAKHLSDMTDDLLSHARLGRAGLKIEHVDLSELAEEAADSVRQEAYCPGQIEFRIQSGLVADADRALLKLAMENLLDNACKYSQHASRALVEVGQDADGFFVRDNGVGFDMAYSSKLFEPFERLHRDPAFQGTGIGLANVKQIIDKHGGKIWADSEPYKGATFHFTLS